MTDEFESGGMNRDEKIAEFGENSLLSNREIENMEVNKVHNDEEDNEDLRNRSGEEYLEEYNSDEDEISTAEDEDVDSDSAGGSNLVEENIAHPKDVTRTLAETFLLLSVYKYATELILQGLIKGVSSAFETCRKEYVADLGASNFSGPQKAAMMPFFEKNFAPFRSSLDLRTGLLRNTYCRHKYYEDNFDVVEPVEVELTKGDWTGANTGKKHFYHYVPTTKTLKVLLKNRSVRDYCENNRISKEENVMFDICDGDIVKKMSFLANHELLI